LFCSIFSLGGVATVFFFEATVVAAVFVSGFFVEVREVTDDFFTVEVAGLVVVVPEAWVPVLLTVAGISAAIV
jgi:hypothetical protein